MQSTLLPPLCSVNESNCLTPHPCQPNCQMMQHLWQQIMITQALAAWLTEQNDITWYHQQPIKNYTKNSFQPHHQSTPTWPNGPTDQLLKHCLWEMLLIHTIYKKPVPLPTKTPGLHQNLYHPQSFDSFLVHPTIHLSACQRSSESTIGLSSNQAKTGSTKKVPNWLSPQQYNYMTFWNRPAAYLAPFLYFQEPAIPGIPLPKQCGSSLSCLVPTWHDN